MCAYGVVIRKKIRVTKAAFRSETSALLAMLGKGGWLVTSERLDFLARLLVTAIIKLAVRG